MNREAAVEMLEFSRLTEVVEIFARILYGYFLGLRYMDNIHWIFYRKFPAPSADRYFPMIFIKIVDKFLTFSFYP